MHFLSNFGCKIIFMRSVNSWHQQDSNSLFKGSIGDMGSQSKWPIGHLKDFRILQGNFLLQMLPIADNILSVCAALCNLLPPLAK